jgi:hypothetical protein
VILPGDMIVVVGQRENLLELAGRASSVAR